MINLIFNRFLISSKFYTFQIIGTFIKNVFDFSNGKILIHITTSKGIFIPINIKPCWMINKVMMYERTITRMFFNFTIKICNTASTIFPTIGINFKQFAGKSIPFINKFSFFTIFIKSTNSMRITVTKIKKSIPRTTTLKNSIYSVQHINSPYS